MPCSDLALPLPSPAVACGVVFTDLQTACHDHEDLVRPRLMTKAVLPTEGKFAALHAALWTHGVFLYVPRGVEVELPFHVVMYNSGDGATMGHMLVALDLEGTRLTRVYGHRTIHSIDSRVDRANETWCGSFKKYLRSYIR